MQLAEAAFHELMVETRANPAPDSNHPTVVSVDRGISRDRSRPDTIPARTGGRWRAFVDSSVTVVAQYCTDQLVSGMSTGAGSSWKLAWTASIRKSKTERPCCVQVAMIVQIRSSQRLARFAPRSLGDVPVDDHKANGLLGQVIGRLDAGRRDKPDVPRAVFLEATGKVFRLGCGRNVFDGCSAQHVAENLQRGGDRLGLHEVPSMDHVEQRRVASKTRRP